MLTSSLSARDLDVIWHPYTQMQTAPAPIGIVRGQGALLFDEQNNAYLDATSSWWVNIHGHAHPHIAQQLAAQALQLEHCIFAGYTHPPAVNLAERLLKILPDNQRRVFYSDNGSTAIEVALKMAIQYWDNKGIRKQKILAFKNAYHGDTFGAMSVSGSPAPVAEPSSELPALKLDAFNWPLSAAWPGMPRPLFDGPIGHFLCVGVVPPANRRTIAELHAKFDAGLRAKSLQQTEAAYGKAGRIETPHTVRFTQEIRHPRLGASTRALELWKREPRARLTVTLDRLSSLAPEVLFLSFGLPGGLPLPVFSSGGVPYTPYRDQLRGSCRDYFAIDGWAHYGTSDGHWLWVTHDAPLVALGAPHVVELSQQEPPEPNRILAMIFDNCWHTNFVADSHGRMEFQFDLVHRASLDRPQDLAEALAGDPIAVFNPAAHEEPPIVERIYRP